MIRVKFNWSSQEVYDSLGMSKEGRMLLRGITRKVSLLKENPRLGNPVAKRLFPKPYRAAGITNLFRLELPLFWRMLYTLVGEEGDLIVLVLDILDHKEYDKRFGYTN